MEGRNLMKRVDFLPPGFQQIGARGCKSREPASELITRSVMATLMTHSYESQMRISDTMITGHCAATQIPNRSSRLTVSNATIDEFGSRQLHNLPDPDGLGDRGPADNGRGRRRLCTARAAWCGF